MKPYAYIILLLVSCYALSSCRSNRSLSEASERDTQLHITEQSRSSTEIKEKKETVVDKTTASTTQENQQSISEATEDKQVAEFEEKKEVKEEFDENGKLKSRTTIDTRRGYTGRTTSGGRSHDVSNRSNSSVGNEQVQETSKTDIANETKTDTELNLQDKENLNKTEHSSSDSRWIQGWEWLMVILPIAVICGIVYLIRNGRKKRKSDSSY